jgi:hypothetical protein
MAEEAKEKEIKDLAVSERNKYNTKKDQYWKMVRDLFPPKISKLKQQQVYNRIHRNEVFAKNR